MSLCVCVCVCVSLIVDCNIVSQTVADVVAMETDAVVMQSVRDKDIERVYYYTI